MTELLKGTFPPIVDRLYSVAIWGSLTEQHGENFYSSDGFINIPAKTGSTLLLYPLEIRWLKFIEWQTVMHIAQVLVKN